MALRRASVGGGASAAAAVPVQEERLVLDLALPAVADVFRRQVRFERRFGSKF